MNLSRAQRILVFTPIVAAVMILAPGCAKAPTAELEQARAALAEAEAADAVGYAPEEWDEARSALTAAEAEIEQQGQKFALTRSYSTSTELLNQATERAVAAIEAARVAEEDARTESAALLGDLRESMQMASTLLADAQGCSRRPKDFALDLASLQGQIDGMNTETATVQSVIDSEDYRSASSQAVALSERSLALITDMQGALNKLGCAPSTLSATT